MSIGHLGVGHIGGCLSVVELLGVLYFEAMRIDPKRPNMLGRDRFICSKGHAGPAV
ncbi:MAG: transketolase, partial [Clostridia bacterium]|nr:transketolase [Clostridia bacterium]